MLTVFTRVAASRPGRFYRHDGHHVMSAQGHVSTGQASSHEDELELIAEIQDPMLKERFLHMMMMKARCNESPGVVAAMIQAAQHQVLIDMSQMIAT